MINYSSTIQPMNASAISLLPSNSSAFSTLDPLTLVTQVVCVIVLMLGIVGNTLVLIVFGSRWSSLKSFEVYMISLAVADLIGTLVVPSEKLHELSNGSFHYIGNVGCNVINFLRSASVTISAFTLVVISCDRYVIIKWPLRERCSNWMLLGISLLPWLIGIAVGIIHLPDNQIVLYKMNPHENIYVCRGNYSSHAQFMTISVTYFCIQTGIPLLLMIVMYGLIIYELFKNNQMEIFQLREREMRARYKRNVKVMKILVAIVVVFFICITPQKIVHLLYSFNPEFIPSNVFFPLYSFVSMLLMVNSCVNPIIYSKLHTSFRRWTLRLFCSCCVRKYRTFSWGTIRESFQSAISTSIRFASSRLSRGSRESSGTITSYFANWTNSAEEKQRLRSASSSVLRKHSVIRSVELRRLSAPARTEISKNEEHCVRDIVVVPKQLSVLEEHESSQNASDGQNDDTSAFNGMDGNENDNDCYLHL